MEFYKRLIIKILEKTTIGENNHLLLKLKSGHDLTQKERAELEELFDSILKKGITVQKDNYEIN